METILNVITLLPLIILAFCMFIAGLVGLIRGLKKTLGSLVVVGLSIVGSLIVTLILCNPESGLIDTLLTKVVQPLLQNLDIGDLSQMSSLTTVIKYYAAMLVGPFLFTLLFFAFRLVFGIIMRIVIKFIPVMKNVPAVANRLGGLGTGLAVGFLVALVALMPLLGTVNVVNVAVANMADVFTTEENAEDEQLYSNVNYDYLADVPTTGEMAENVDGASSSDEADIMAILTAVGNMSDKGVGKVLRVVGADALYTATSEQKYNGKTVSLETEINGISHLVVGVTKLASGIETGKGFAEALAELASATEASPLVNMAAADIVSSAATSWASGEAFMGIEISTEEMGLVKPLMDAIFEALASADEATITEDIKTVQAAVEVLEKYDVFASMEDEEALLEIFGKNPILSELEATFGANENMAAVGEEISNVTMKAFVNVIDVPDKGDENYEDYLDLTDTIADAVNENYNLTLEEKRAKIAEEIKKAATEYGVDLEEYTEVINYATDKFIEEFAHRNDVVGDEIREFVSQFDTEE